MKNSVDVTFLINFFDGCGGGFRRRSDSSLGEASPRVPIGNNIGRYPRLSTGGSCPVCAFTRPGVDRFLNAARPIGTDARSSFRTM